MTFDSRAEHRAGGPTTSADRDERERTFTRRALVQAGWSVPVILAVAPSVAFAASGVQHVDATHNDHIDAGAHVDVGVQASVQSGQQAMPFSSTTTPVKKQTHHAPAPSRRQAPFTG